MAERADMLVHLAETHGPASVRHLFYLAVVNSVVGITKNDSGYRKVQSLILELRRSGAIPYYLIEDGSRLRYHQSCYDGVSEALDEVASFYRRDLWRQAHVQPEIWCESRSIAGVILDTAHQWTVPVLVSGGDSSETFAWNAAQEWKRTEREPTVFYIGDHDGAGLGIEDAIYDKLTSFYGDDVAWRRIALTYDQATTHGFPSQPAQPKDRRRGYELDVKREAEAMPPDQLRRVVDVEIAHLADTDQVSVLRVAEESERDLLERFARREFTT